MIFYLNCNGKNNVTYSFQYLAVGMDFLQTDSRPISNLV